MKPLARSGTVLQSRKTALLNAAGYPRQERPIVFCGEMVKATLEGKKSQDRKLVKLPITRGIEYRWINARKDGGPSSPFKAGEYLHIEFRAVVDEWMGQSERIFCPYGVVGDILWVRETLVKDKAGVSWRYKSDGSSVSLPLDHPKIGAMASWCRDRSQNHCPSTHMPQWASRITLEITEIRGQRLQEISEEDAWAEGCRKGLPTDNGGHFPAEKLDDPKDPRSSATGWDCAIDWYADFWNSHNRGNGWQRNSWVWAMSFRRITR